MQCTPHFLPKHCKVMSQRYNIDVPNCSIIDANFFVVLPRFGTCRHLLCSRIEVKPFNNK